MVQERASPSRTDRVQPKIRNEPLLENDQLRFLPADLDDRPRLRNSLKRCCRVSCDLVLDGVRTDERRRELAPASRCPDADNVSFVS